MSVNIHDAAIGDDYFGYKTVSFVLDFFIFMWYNLCDWETL